jgi:hypothetical protein
VNISQQYSQNAPLPSGDPASAEVTCYGAIDGSSCLVSDINFTSAGVIRSVECSGADGVCYCFFTTKSDPWPVMNPNAVAAGSFPFVAGACPTGVGGMGTLGAISADVCSTDGVTLFARCHW